MHNLEKKYSQLPTCNIDCSQCREKECCTVAPCSKEEKCHINKWIKRNNPKLPLIHNKFMRNYVLPNSLDCNSYRDFQAKGVPACSYLIDGKCAIYEVRPVVCRLFGAIRQMACGFFPEKAVTDLPVESFIELGLMRKPTPIEMEQVTKRIKEYGDKYMTAIKNHYKT